MPKLNTLIIILPRKRNIPDIVQKIAMTFMTAYQCLLRADIVNCAPNAKCHVHHFLFYHMYVVIKSDLCSCFQGNPADYEKAITASKQAWDLWSDVSTCCCYGLYAPALSVYNN